VRRAAPPFAIFLATALCWSAASLAHTALQTPTTSADDIPHSLDAFQRAARRIIEETGVAGAGLALVRQDAVEWAGGVGYADRDRQLPVTDTTAFRVGSISKTFVAMGLVQLAEDGLIDLDAPIAEIVADIAFDNVWEDSEPVRVIHLLQHTAGFDDMHFNEMYVPRGAAERSLEDVLRINPRSRRVRWQPGTRMSYSNPGYAIAGLILERGAGMPYEDYIEQEIFRPLEMNHSSFRLNAQTESTLAQGYASPDGPPVGFPHIYLRPAGNMISTPRDMARFVQMMLGWGELGHAFVVDPEYLGNMEQPRTTLAASAGLRNGYGSGIFPTLTLPYKVLGHDGGIDGFIASYAYSPSRDVGYVVLLNSTGPRAGEAMRRLAMIALSYLKRDVESPQRPEVHVEPQVLDRYTGYYHDANPRNQIVWPVQSLFSGRQIVRDGNALYLDPVVGERERLIPVTDTMFRTENELEASRVFVPDADGVMILAGLQLYAERTSRWPVDATRLALFAALTTLASVPLVALAWAARIKRARPRGFWELKLALLLCPLAVLLPVAGLWWTPMAAWGARNSGTMGVYLGTLAIPTLALSVAILTLMAIRERASRRLVTYAGAVALAMAGLSLYLSQHEALGLRLWEY
jgi:CubicO group peptidase (beta-lactamase class C family)